jgi:hypothetical protein
LKITNTQLSELKSGQRYVTRNHSKKSIIFDRENADIDETPGLNEQLTEYQIENLLEKVNLNNTFLSMATNDQKLITLMKDTIMY